MPIRLETPIQSTQYLRRVYLISFGIYYTASRVHSADVRRRLSP